MRDIVMLLLAVDTMISNVLILFILMHLKRKDLV